MRVMADHCPQCDCEFAGRWGAGVDCGHAPTPHHWHTTFNDKGERTGGYLAHGDPHTVEGTPLFNEDSLRWAIRDTWGEHGAHMEVFDHLMKRSRTLDAIYLAIRDVKVER